MKCSDVKSELYFLAVGQINAEKEIEVRNHLKGCSACNIRHSDFVKTLGKIDKIDIEFPQKNWNYFAEKIVERISRKSRFTFLKPVMAFGLGLFIVLVGYKYYQQNKLQGTYISQEMEETTTYLADFEIPELYQQS